MVAQVGAVSKLDAHGYRATLVVERDLAEAAGGGAGESIEIGWEELAEGRPARFEAGERVLVALAPLPGWSLWRQRFPKGNALAVGEKGLAFLRDPDAPTADALARYLRVAVVERSEAPGVEALARLVADAADPVARGAVERLDAVPGLGGKLREPAAAALGGALTDPARSDALRRALLALAGKRQLDALRDAIRATTAQGPPLAGPAWAALAVLDGGLPSDTVKRLVDDPDADVRAVGMGFAVGAGERERARRAITEDSAPVVRAAAVTAVVVAGDEAGQRAGEAALFDREADVRLAAAQAFGRVGTEAVPRLRELALGRSGEGANGPLGALAYAGPEGQAALLELSFSHPDEKTRGQARLFLGLDPKKH